jgi:hypothetical protein
MKPDLREVLDALDSALDSVCGAADELRYRATLDHQPAALPDGSVLVTREPLDVERLMRTMRYHPDLRGQRHQFREGWDAAVLALLAALAEEPTDAPAEPLTTAVDAKAARGACAICGHNRSDPCPDERSSGFHEYERGGMGVVVIDYDAPSGAGDSVEAYRG